MGAEKWWQLREPILITQQARFIYNIGAYFYPQLKDTHCYHCCLFNCSYHVYTMMREDAKKLTGQTTNTKTKSKLSKRKLSNAHSNGSSANLLGHGNLWRKKVQRNDWISWTFGVKNHDEIWTFRSSFGSERNIWWGKFSHSHWYFLLRINNETNRLIVPTNHLNYFNSIYVHVNCNQMTTIEIARK